MRTVYEDTEAYKQYVEAEKTFKEYLESVKHIKMVKLPKKYSADFIAFKEDRINCLIEFKRRNKAFGNGSFTISLHKFYNSLTYADLLDVPCLLFIQFDDMLVFCNLQWRYTQNIEMSRDYRNEADDVEPTVIISWNSFSKFVPE